MADTLSRKKKIVRKTPHSVATYIVGMQAGTHSAIMCKTGNGRHAYTCAWPRPPRNAWA